MTDLERAQHVADIASTEPEFGLLYSRWAEIESLARTVHRARLALRADVVMAEATGRPDTDASAGRCYLLDALNAVLG
jgi:hypothetical protein